MQSASDIFLGWTEGEAGRHFYVRQLKDMKIKPVVEVFTPGVMIRYAELCGWALAHAHARSGEPGKISGYLGKSDVFDRSIANFAVAYADQSEQDHDVLMKAVRAGKLEVFVEEE
jgi:NAD(P)H-dependent flavin oxidoreductase YrpB (nitropropane dioxygenase family)